MRRDSGADKTDLIWKLDFSRYGDTLDHHPDQTIRPPRGALDTAGRSAIGVLEALFADESARSGGRPGARLELADTIGSGGLGVVRQAHQVALDRDVAVKTLHPNHRTEGAVLGLLHEAWVAGSLEHPNVVPVYDVALDRSGAPLIVLKRIEGVAWNELIRDPGRVRDRFGAEDLLEWNLGVLLQVLNAVRYAHSRGIVHRDLKPANVMIGEFGEVYLVDWGLAVSVADDRSGRLPLARDATSMAGTPMYMAPEMLGQGDLPITERTDIYLIGAILYEILAGKPPHGGDTAMALVTSVVVSDPDYPIDAPHRLIRICRRAMDPDPDGRFENAEQIRLAIQGFLQHRGSEQLAHNAEVTLVELQAEIDRDPGPGPGPGSDAEHRQRLYKLFGACRFGFREALATWHRNPTARAGLERATVAMVEYEIAQGDPRAAAALCAELPDPPASLRARIEEADRTHAEDKQRAAQLASLGRQLDMSVGQKARFVAVAILGLSFALVPPLAAWQLGSSVVRSHEHIAFWNTVFLVLCVGVGVAMRRSLRESPANRRLYSLLMLVLVVQLPMQLGLWRAGFPPEQSLLAHVFVWFFLATIVAVTFDLRLLPAALAYLAAYLTLSVLPDLTTYIISAPHGVLTINAALIWRPRQ